MTGAAAEGPRPAGRGSVTLVLEGVCRHYESGTSREARALDGIDLSIEPGALTVVCGPSGSGKTTLMGLLGALDRPTRGRILLDGADLATLPDARLAAIRRSRIGILFQAFHLIPGLPVWANVTTPLIPQGMTWGRRRAVAAELLAHVGLDGVGDRAPLSLSGGEQQRVALARALVQSPPVLILDEPTSAMDDATARHILALIEEEVRRGTTVVAATHDPHLRDRASVRLELRGGRLVSP